MTYVLMRWSYGVGEVESLSGHWEYGGKIVTMAAYIGDLYYSFSTCIYLRSEPNHIYHASHRPIKCDERIGYSMVDK